VAVDAARLRRFVEQTPLQQAAAELRTTDPWLRVWHRFSSALSCTETAHILLYTSTVALRALAAGADDRPLEAAMVVAEAVHQATVQLLRHLHQVAPRVEGAAPREGDAAP
jgi:hypothetical protein